MQVPFSGSILTAMAIILLISFSYRWKENGLFWRAGLICALMKTISPSAVIFGPMIAIFSESVLIEVSIRLFGRTFIGFALGSMLAMSWNLFQKIVNFLISYGFNIVELYSGLISLAQKQLHIQSDILWLPLMVLLILFAVFGLFSAIVGIKTGRRLQQQLPVDFDTPQTSTAVSGNRSRPEFKYSLLWLLVNVLSIVAALFLQNFSKPVYWISFITVVVVVWAFRYKRAMRQLARPGFWVFFVVMTMLTSFVFAQVQGKSRLEGLLIGFQMNFRAILIITGFSMLGTELYNPRIRGFFLKTSFKQLPLALELSFESLPAMISRVPDFKAVAKNPVLLVYNVMQQAEVSLAQIRKRLQSLSEVYIISGAVGEGKTSFLLDLADELQARNIKAGGFLSLRQMENGETIGYDLLDISTRQPYGFLRRFSERLSDKRIGRFSILEEGLSAGKRILEAESVITFDVLIVDEVGKLELNGGGWADQLKVLPDSTHAPCVIAIRKGFEHQVLAHFQILKYEIVPVGKIKVADFANRISENVSVKKHKK
jgi:nucleoside-triphosphatase THEP1